MGSEKLPYDRSAEFAHCNDADRRYIADQDRRRNEGYVAGMERALRICATPELRAEIAALKSLLESADTTSKEQP